MLLLVRLLFLIIFGLLGYFLSFLVPAQNTPYPQWVFNVLGTSLGVLLWVLLAGVTSYARQFTVRNIIATLVGLLIGLLINHFFMLVIAYADLPIDTYRVIGVIMGCIFAFLGVITVLMGKDEFAILIPFVKLEQKGAGEEMILLDTSVIIDGRIADMVDTHFLPGTIIVPRFVLKELQLISDSSDPLKRARGRRGLDVLNRVKKNQNVQVKINEMDFPEFTTVDAKLVKMGQTLGAKVFTNDFNLNKVAELQGVKVLNINELANALKPIVMPGETMQVKILKEGKEHDQGVAYLDDGTMVVVDNGRRRLGQTLTVVITSVLQTQAGRMIFAKMGTEPERQDRAGRDRGGRPEHRRGRGQENRDGGR